MKKQLLFTTSLLLSSAMAFAAGYQINLQGLRQLAMGGSGTAIAWDASTIFYNPGGLSELDHIQAQASMIAVMPTTEFVQGSYTASTQSQVFTPFNVYVGGPVAYKSRVNWGIGIYTPFGTGVKWEENWAGRYMVTNIQLKTVFFQPTASFRINDYVSVGAGFIYAMGNMQLNRNLPLQNQNLLDGKADLNGDAHGIGYNLGVQVKPSYRVTLGVNYRSRVNMKVNQGNVQFTVPNALTNQFPLTSFSSELPLPSVTSIGIGYKLTDELTVQGDFNFTSWSAYENLSFDYAQNTSLLQDTREERNYQNTLSFRLGGHLEVSDKVALMIGGAWDPSPVRDGIVTPDLPDANRWLATGGITYKPAEKLTLMAAVEYVSSLKRDSRYDAAGFNGMYKTTALNPGIGLSFDF
jgi:long-chain fatty acid transport protein